MNKDLVALFEYLEREKGITRDIVIDALKESLEIAARKSVNNVGNVSVSINAKTGEIDATVEKEIVLSVEYPEEEISLEHARELDPDCETGQWIEVTVTPKNFGRIAAQIARQVITQKLRSAERDVIYEEYRDRVGSTLSGTVKRITKGGSLIIDLGKVEAILPDRFCPKNEQYSVGEKVVALLYEVRDTETGGAEVVLSRSHPKLVQDLLEQEVPEVSEGTIIIHSIVREAGYKTKLSVSSTDHKIDPVGACVGVRGGRIKNIIRELEGERIDIIPHSDDPIELLRRAMAPIEPVKIDIHDDTISVVVDDEDYPIILGKRGANARLIAGLIDFETTFQRESDKKRETALEMAEIASSENTDLDEALSLPEANTFVIESLIESGYDTARKILSTNPQALADELAISVEVVEAVIEQIKKQRT